jgi:hypothetical protein
VKLRTTLIALFALALVACAKPLAPERLPYAGEWAGAGMTLIIDADGRVEYHRKNGTASKSIKAPLKEFQGDNFLVGIGSLATTFIVAVPPHEDGDAWKMTVDGIELTKQPPGTLPRDVD